VAARTRKYFNPVDYAVFSMGTTQMGIFQSRLNAIYEEAGKEPGPWLLNFGARQEIKDIRREMQLFLDSSTVVENYIAVDGITQSKSFNEMWEQYTQFRDMHEGETPSLTAEQQHLLDFDTEMDEFALYFSPNPDSSDEYFKLREAAFNALPEGGGPLSQGTNWWFNEVSSPYYDELDQLYKKKDRANERDQGLVFMEIRRFSDSYNKPWTNPEHPEWGEFPSPEAYVFAKLQAKDPVAARQQVTEWAARPATWLTEFQREQVGYDIPEGKQDEASRLADLVTRGEYKMKKALVQAGISEQSLTGQAIEAALDNLYAERAKEWGVEDFWKQANEPEYRRIDDALGLSNRNATWAGVARHADRLIEGIQEAGYSASGQAEAIRGLYVYLRDEVARKRVNDSAFDDIMYELSVVMGDGTPMTNDDLVLKLFFDVFDRSRAFYLD